MNNRMASKVAVILWLSGCVLGLRDIQLSVPEAVGVGASAVLGCRWALDTGETLYTVKWYHGAQEFFRFVPKELPNTRVFSQTGISVDISRSGAQQVVLRAATRELSGRYRCEVSADAPFFHTVYKSATMRVVELPDSKPKVVSQKSWYSIGDMLRANCTSPPSDPPANLTWLLNGYEIRGLDIPPPEIAFARGREAISDSSLEDANRIIFSPWDAISGYEEAVTDVIDIPGNIDALVRGTNNGAQALTISGKVAQTQAISEDAQALAVSGKLEGLKRRDPSPAPELAVKSNITEEERSNKTSSSSQLIIRVQSSHFQKGRVNVTCVAQILSAWSASGTLLLDEERPQIAPVMGSRDSNSGPRCTSHVVFMLLCVAFTKHWSIR
ncbi:uncharacterized protein LOC121731377 [Aricia agestis]|uniref:uncharacterized protein LOC121731377 n=1 Tax=Aricia agestis TaxID=91739 RepID=UPI001C20998B|nr:uncharacterized protein LOC121731377 [Aricia agestis]